MAALGALLAATALPAAAQSTSRANRIKGTLSSGTLFSMAGSVSPLARRATDVGPVDPEMELGSLTMNFGLTAAQHSELDGLLAAQQDPASPQYHHWLTQKQYGERFGMTEADLQTVSAWLGSQGFTVNGVSTSRNAIYFSGRAWQVESAFHTQLHNYQWQGQRRFANATALELPAGLGGVVLNIRGLNNFRLKPHAVRQMAPAYTDTTTVHYLAPGDWATIYNVNALYSAGFTGAGSYVGVVGQTYAPQSDIDNFRSAAGLPATNLIYKCISTSQATDCSQTQSGDLGEADLDIEWAGGIAKDATVVYVYAAANDQNKDVVSALQYAVQSYTVPSTGQPLPVISMSYGSCELYYSSPSDRSALDQIGMEANAQGQTIVVSSGDSGAAGCDPISDYPASMGEYVDVPADSPYFTGVGGTTLSGDETTPSNYWNQIMSPPVDTALAYIPETSWNDTSSSYGLAASGGGVSQYYPQPDGSSGTGGFTQPTPGNFTGSAGRFVPDISFSASAEHDGYLICSLDNDSSTYGNDCSNGFLTSKNYLFVAGGTSAGTPSFAGMLTLLEQRFGSQGNFNVTLYNLAANSSTYASAFHDITSGDNIVPCTPGVSDPGCDYGTATMGYSTATGYDMVTGLGSINAGALYAAMGPPLNATTTTVSASPNPAVLNSVTTLSATVSSTASGTISGSLTFTVNGTTVGTATLSGGTATLSNVAVSSNNGFVTGSNTVTAYYAYSGAGSNFAASNGSVAVNVLASKPATTLKLNASPSSATLNDGITTETLTATVTSATAGTITGTVTFTVNNHTLGTVTLSGGTATLSNVAVSAANGFTGGTETIAATYGGDAVYAASSGSTQITVAAFSMSANPASVTMSAGSSTPVTLNLSSSDFSGTVSFTVASSNAAAVTGSTPAPVTLTSNGSGTTTLTISVAATAANRTPALPWQRGGAVAFALLLGAPLTLRKRRALRVLLMVLALCLAGMLLSCGGKSSTPPTAILTVTPQPNATASAVTIPVYVK